MNIKITDNISQMEKIGREIINQKADIYTPLMLSTIQNTINRFMPNNTEKEKEKALYRSVYDYWVYGNGCDEEFFYGFREKTHEQKKEYITFRLKPIYCNRLNNKECADLFVDKYKTYQRFKEYYLRDVIQINGDEDFEIFEIFVKKHPSFVVKPKDMALGIGVYVVNEGDYTDLKELFDSIRQSGKKTKEEVVWAKNDSIVLEEIIAQDEALAALHPDSANGVRITTIRKGNNVIIYHPWLKIGTDHHFVTCSSLGTLLAGINPDTGIVETNGIKETGEEFIHHPDTEVKIPGFIIPKWDELVSMAKKLALSLDKNINIVGWDFVLTPKGWCIMEGNYDGNFMWQYIYNKGMKREFEELIGWEYKKDFWWQD